MANRVFNERIVPASLRPSGGDGTTVDESARWHAGAVKPRGVEPETGFSAGEAGKPLTGPIHPHGS